MHQALHRRMLWGAAAATLLLCAASAADREGFRRYLQLRQEIERRAQRNASLAEQNAMLVREISALRNEPSAQERAVREELGFIKPGEVVIRLEAP